MNPLLGQIILFAGNFAPRGWALCEGQILAINQNQALFSLLGTTYGGDGRTSFALPDLRGRAPVSVGHGAGLSNYTWGEKTGTETNTISEQQMPSHNHVVAIPTDNQAGTELNGYLGAAPIYAEESNSTLPDVTMTHTGGGQPVNNLQPFLALNYIIALQGTFPSRN